MKRPNTVLLATVLLATVLLATVLLAGALARPADAEARLSRFTDFCSLQDGAPITKTCFGFMSAILELAEDGEVFRYPVFFDRICIEGEPSVQAAVEKMRPWLRKRGEMCNGHCDATGYAIEALAAVYPCKKSN